MKVGDGFRGLGVTAAAVRRVASVLLVVGCAGSVDPEGTPAPGEAPGAQDGASSSDAGASPAGGDFGNVDPGAPRTDLTGVEPPMPSLEDWSMDPPPMECLEDGTTRSLGEPPDGTLECPSDKNREGCPCGTIGESVPCWPGLRVNRERGRCMDGITTCEAYPEFGGVLGACEGYVLPDPWVHAGPGACRCFSAGSWEIDNLSPCFHTVGQQVFATSTVVDPVTGDSGCADPGALLPGQQPGVPPTPWSTSRITVDCAGRYELCYAIKSGDVANPQPSDCTLVEVCVETWYEVAGVAQELPLLPAWSSPDSGCALAFQQYGGYGEMTVKGLSIECDPVDDGDGEPYAFDRRRYCPVICGSEPTLPECQNCAQGGSGNF